MSEEDFLHHQREGLFVYLIAAAGARDDAAARNALCLEVTGGRRIPSYAVWRESDCLDRMSALRFWSRRVLEMRAELKRVGRLGPAGRDRAAAAATDDSPVSDRCWATVARSA